MSDDTIAPLGFSVDTEGLNKAENAANKAADSFDKLGQSAEDAQKSTQNAAKSADEMGKALNQSADAAQKSNSALKNHNNSILDHAKATSQAQKETEKLGQTAKHIDSSGFGKSLSQGAKQLAADMTEGSTAGKALAGVMTDVGAAGGIAGTLIAGTVVAVAALGVAYMAAAAAGSKLEDAQIPIEARFKAITQSASQAKAAMDDALSNARGNSTSLEASQQSLQAWVQAESAIGLVRVQSTALASELDKISQISGKSEQDMVSFSKSVSDGLKDGVVSAQELNGWFTQMPDLANTLADGMGKSKEEIQQMAAAGKLFSTDFINGLQNGAKGVEERFGGMKTQVSSIQNDIKLEWNETLKAMADSVHFHEIEVSFYETIKKGLISAREFFQGMDWKGAGAVAGGGVLSAIGMPGIGIPIAAGGAAHMAVTGGKVYNPPSGQDLSFLPQSRAINPNQVLQGNINRNNLNVRSSTFAGNPHDRGIRNNNPGNIEYGPVAAANGAIGHDGRFAIFPDMATGFRAQQAVMYNKAKNKQTLAQAITSYAPPGENDTAAYIANVSRLTGIQPNQQLDPSNANQIYMLARASTHSEGTSTAGSAAKLANAANQNSAAAQGSAKLNQALSLINGGPVGSRSQAESKIQQLQAAMPYASAQQKQQLQAEIMRIQNGLQNPIDRMKESTALQAQYGPGGGAQIAQNAHSLNESMIAGGYGSNNGAAMAAATSQAVVGANNATEALERQNTAQKAVNATIGQSRTQIRDAQIEQQVYNFSLQHFGNVVTPETIAATGRYRAAIKAQMEEQDRARVAQQAYDATLQRSITIAETAAMAEGARGYALRAARIDAQAAAADAKMPGTGAILKDDFDANEANKAAQALQNVQQQGKNIDRKYATYVPDRNTADSTTVTVVAPKRATNPYEDRLSERWHEIIRLSNEYGDSAEIIRQQQENWAKEDENRANRRKESDERSLGYAQDELRIAGMTRAQREIELALLERKKQLVESGDMRPTDNLNDNEANRVRQQVAANKAVALENDYTQTAENDNNRLAALRAQLDLSARIGQERRIQLAILQREADLISRGLLEPGQHLSDVEAERLANITRQTEQYEQQRQHIEDMANLIPQSLSSISEGLKSVMNDYFENGKTKAEDLAKLGRRIAAGIATNIVDTLVIKPATRFMTSAAESAVNSLFKKGSNNKTTAVNDNVNTAAKAAQEAATRSLMIKQNTSYITSVGLMNATTNKTVLNFVTLNAVVSAATKSIAAMAAASQAKSGSDTASTVATIATTFAAHGTDNLHANTNGGMVGSRPMIFAAHGATMAFEAGPEAVLPLQRGADGKLGVANYANNNSGSGGNVSVTVNDYRGSGESPQVETTTGVNGQKQISITIRDAVRSGLSSGEYDKQMNSTYGSSRQVARR